MVKIGDVRPRCSKCGSGNLTLNGEVALDAEITCNECGSVAQLKDCLSEEDQTATRNKLRELALEVAKQHFKLT